MEGLYLTKLKLRRIVVVVVLNLKMQLRHMKTKDPIHDSRYNFFLFSTLIMQISHTIFQETNNDDLCPFTTTLTSLKLFCLTRFKHVLFIEAALKPMFVHFKFSTLIEKTSSCLLVPFAKISFQFHYVRTGFPKHVLLVCLKPLFVISRAFSEADFLLVTSLTLRF